MSLCFCWANFGGKTSGREKAADGFTWKRRFSVPKRTWMMDQMRANRCKLAFFNTWQTDATSYTQKTRGMPTIQESYNTPLEHTPGNLRSPTMKGIPWKSLFVKVARGVLQLGVLFHKLRNKNLVIDGENMKNHMPGDSKWPFWDGKVTFWKG